MDFATPVRRIRLDAIANSNGDIGRLEIFDSGGDLLARYQTSELAAGEVETMELVRQASDIAMAKAYGNGDSAVHLDNLRFGPEVTATTDALGGYRLEGFEPGDYTLEVQLDLDQLATNPASGQQTVTVFAGQPAHDADFGVAPAALWQNPVDRFDVDDNGLSLSEDSGDILTLVSDLILNGVRELPTTPPPGPPPYLDVNGDGFFLTDDLVDLVSATVLDLEDSGGGEGAFLGQPGEPGGQASVAAGPVSQTNSELGVEPRHTSQGEGEGRPAASVARVDLRPAFAEAVARIDGEQVRLPWCWRRRKSFERQALQGPRARMSRGETKPWAKSSIGGCGARTQLNEPKTRNKPDNLNSDALRGDADKRISRHNWRRCCR